MSIEIAPDRPTSWQSAFLQRHQLPSDYLETAHKWFTPLVAELAAHQKSANSTLLVGINGSQGSGKTTLVDYLVSALCVEHDVPALSLSLDDFYLPQVDRRALAAQVHPLLATRGVPGTHDLALLNGILDQLAGVSRLPVVVPQFDKSSDDPFPEDQWLRVVDPPRIILLEGWCLGAQPEDTDSLTSPVNQLERDEDPNCEWRQYVNDVLRSDFLPLYQQIDQWLMLEAPSFDCVHGWRLEQENKLVAQAGGGSGLMDSKGIENFIQHFQRLTENCLSCLPDKADYLFTLDSQRRITKARYRKQVCE